MKLFLENYLFGKDCSMKSALTLMFFLLATQPGFLVPAFLSSALADTKGIGKGILVAPVKLEFEGRTRSGTFKVLNRDNEKIDYRIVFAPLVAPHHPLEAEFDKRNVPPVWDAEGTSENLLGGDHIGRDVLSRIIFGARISLLVAVTVLIAGTLVGTALGIVAGYVGGIVDEVLMRLGLELLA